MRKKLVLIGGGGHCKSCIDVIEQTGLYDIIGILDKQDLIGQTVLGYSIIETDKQIELLVKEGYEFLITVGQIKSPHLRQALYDKLSQSKAKMATIISPRSYVSKHATIGGGSIVMHDALINADACIGENCIINSKALIEHDAVVGDFCHISTAAIINGGVEIMQGTFFGSNATSKEYVKTPNQAFIKASSLFLGNTDE